MAEKQLPEIQHMKSVLNFFIEYLKPPCSALQPLNKFIQHVSQGYTPATPKPFDYGRACEETYGVPTPTKPRPPSVIIFPPQYTQPNLLHGHVA